MIGWRGIIIAAVLVHMFASLPVRAGEDVNPAGAPYFNLSDDEKSYLIERLKTINLGDNWDDVKRILGKPDIDQDSVTKKLEFLARERSYNVYLVSDGANMNDERVHLFFDRKDKLILIISTIKEYTRNEGSVR